MGRFRDRKKVGQSAIVPYVHGEGAHDRHYRRLKTNVELAAEASVVLEQMGYKLTIHNDGHHWVLRGGRDVWEWWPSSAKLVRNREYRRGIHCHDWQQMVGEIRKAK